MARKSLYSPELRERAVQILLRTNSCHLLSNRSNESACCLELRTCGLYSSHPAPNGHRLRLQTAAADSSAGCTTKSTKIPPQPAKIRPAVGRNPKQGLLPG